MKKKVTMSKLTEVQKRNMKKWTEEDYKMYNDFFRGLLTPDEEKPEEAEEEITKGEPPDKVSKEGSEEDKE